MALVRRGFALLSRLRSPTLLGGYGESKARLAHSVILLIKLSSQTYQEILEVVWTPDPSVWRIEGCGLFDLLTLNSAWLPLVFKTSEQVLWGCMIADTSALKHKSSSCDYPFLASLASQTHRNAISWMMWSDFITWCRVSTLPEKYSWSVFTASAVVEKMS